MTLYYTYVTDTMYEVHTGHMPISFSAPPDFDKQRIEDELYPIILGHEITDLKEMLKIVEADFWSEIKDWKQANEGLDLVLSPAIHQFIETDEGVIPILCQFYTESGYTIVSYYFICASETPHAYD